MMDLILRIKEAVTIEEALSRFGVEIPSRGRDPVMVRCPWHEDRNPSMAVYRREGRAWCFACQRGGDVLDITAAFIGGGVKDALDYWAVRLGLSREKSISSGEAGKLRIKVLQDRERKWIREIARKASLLAEHGLRPEKLSETPIFDVIYEVKDGLDKGLSFIEDRESLDAYLRGVVSWRRWAERFLKDCREKAPLRSTKNQLLSV